MNVAAVIALLLFIWPFSSGGKTYHMTSSNAVPAASGTVQVKTEKGNSNVDLDIKVANLAQPANLAPAEGVYIIWIRPNGGTAIKKGAIEIGSNLQGERKLVTTSRNFEVFITAEPGVTVTSPSGPGILHVNIKLQG